LDRHSNIALGEIRSNQIQLISKPSKKMAKSRCNGLAISNGQLVSFFTRINSQTVRTKYMAVSPSGFIVAQSGLWSPLRIRMIRKAEQLMGTTTGSLSDDNQDIILYNSLVVLEDTAGHLRTDPMLIRKVEKNSIVYDAVGPVSQLHRIAFQSTNMYQNYWGASQRDVVLSRKSSLNENDKHHAEDRILFHPSYFSRENEVLDDNMCWTIAGVDSFESSFLPVHTSDADSSVILVPIADTAVSCPYCSEEK
jgi:recombining binding protein (suppressor of hairless)